VKVWSEKLSIVHSSAPWENLLLFILRVTGFKLSFVVSGVKVIFKVALVLLKSSLGQPGILKQCPTMYETLETLRNPPEHCMEETYLTSRVSLFRRNLSWLSSENHFAPGIVFRIFTSQEY